MQNLKSINKNEEKWNRSFLACTSHPECDFIRSHVFPTDDQHDELVEDKILGSNEEGTIIILKKGPLVLMFNLEMILKMKKLKGLPFQKTLI